LRVVFSCELDNFLGGETEGAELNRFAFGEVFEVAKSLVLHYQLKLSQTQLNNAVLSVTRSALCIKLT